MQLPFRGQTGGLVAVTLSTLSVAVATPATADAHGCAHANTPAVAVSKATMRRAVDCLINRQRRAHHLPALKPSARLNRSAQGWTNRMVRTDEFSHGTDFASRISAVGLNWSAAGENIATGYPTPMSVVKGWMASQGHCYNILAPIFSRVGTGLDTSGIGSEGTRAATWTQDFALPMGAREPSHNFGPADGCPYRI